MTSPASDPTDGSPSSHLPAWLEETRVWAERELLLRVRPAETEPARLHEAMRYALFGGGKRLRPALVRLVARHLGAGDAQAGAPGAAIELVHTYSLVHDDLPCMDDDDLRRGRPTCHVVYGEALAVLTGDALLTTAFELCAAEPDAGRLVACLAAAAGSVGMVGGQVLDLASSDTAPASSAEARAEVHRIHSLKTAALFGAAAELGAIAAGADAERSRRAAAFGRALGLAFQATDDLLDVTGDALTLGKTPGKDADLERGTLVAAVGLSAAEEEARRLAREAERAAAELPGSEGGLLQALVGFVLARRA